METFFIHIGVLSLLVAALIGGATLGALRANGPEAPVLGIATLVIGIPGAAILALLVAVG